MKSKNAGFISGNAKVVRNINRAVILNLIREKQPISRIEIARWTGLNKSTVSSIVADLIAEDLVHEEVEANQNVGRNPLNLFLKLGSHLVGAINIDSPLTRIAVADLDGSLKENATIATGAEKPGPFVKRCVSELFKLRDRLRVSHFAGIGVSIAGIVDPVQACVRFAPRLGWEGFEIGRHLQQLCPEEGMIIVDNDARASALAELWYGRHNLTLSNFVFLSVGPGIGTGIVVERNLIRGHSFASGEFGHMTLFEGGELCACGNHGCWEAYASDRATVRRYLARRPHEQARTQPMLLQEVIDLAVQQNDTSAREVLLQTGHYLGIGMAGIIKALDPEAIIIGGKITHAWQLIYPEIRQTLEKRAFFGQKREVQILPTSLKVRPRLLGAATLVIRELFSDFKIIR
ncbi:MAG: N-acetylglucosamine repressor [bacterium]|nr:N-acetylglucosamine repressor [bacterium]